MREDNDRVTPVGLFDLDRNIRAVGTAYRQIIADWSSVLPTQSYCLVLPVDMPGANDTSPANDRLLRQAVTARAG